MPSRGLTRRDRTVYNIACSCAHCMFTSRPEGQKSTTSEKGVGQHVSVSTRMYRRQPLPSAIRVWSQTRPPREHALREISIFLFAASPPLSLSLCARITVIIFHSNSSSSSFFEIGIICRKREKARRFLTDFLSNVRPFDITRFFYHDPREKKGTFHVSVIRRHESADF